MERAVVDRGLQAAARDRVVARGAKYDATYVVPAVTFTGEENVAVCHPEAVSFVNVASRAREPPVAVHRLPVWVPRFPRGLVEADARDRPLKSAWNFTPSSTALGRRSRDVAGVARSKIVACGVTAPDGLDAGLEPTAFFAITLNV